MLAQIGSIDDGKKKQVRNVDKNKEEDDDNFGAKDEDWNVYKNLSKTGYKEEEDEIMQSLSEINEQIADVDPDYQCLFNIQTDQKPPTAEEFQIKLGVDQFRGTEILFKPSIIGREYAGITEVLE